MNSVNLLALFHHLLSYTVFGAVIALHLMLAPNLNFAQAKRVKVLNKILCIGVFLLLAIGIFRVIGPEKGMQYYAKNWLFHAKFGLYVLLIALIAFHTILMSRWSSALSAGNAPTISNSDCKKMLMSMRLELLVMVFIMVCATLMARGVGMIVAPS